jgi:hypothetical protein
VVVSAKKRHCCEKYFGRLTTVSHRVGDKEFARARRSCARSRTKNPIRISANCRCFIESSAMPSKIEMTRSARRKAIDDGAQNFVAGIGASMLTRVCAHSA